MAFVQRCVDPRRRKPTPCNPTNSSHYHQPIYVDVVANSENGKQLLHMVDEPRATDVFSELAGHEPGEVERAEVNAELGGHTNTMPLCLLIPVSHVVFASI